MRSHDDEIGPGFLGDPENLGVDARAVSHQDLGLQVIGVDAADESSKLVFQVGVTPWNGQDSTVSRTGSGIWSGSNGRAKVCCCRAKRSEPVRTEADIGIPQIIAGEIDVLPADRGKVG
jgi:hypothetical protein